MRREALYAAAKAGAAQAQAPLSEQELWALCVGVTEPQFAGLQALVLRVPELRAWSQVSARSVKEGAAQFAEGLRRAGRASIAYVLHSSVFRAAQAVAGEPPKEDPVSDGGEKKSEAQEVDKYPEGLEQKVLAWHQADEVLAEAEDPLQRRIAQRQRDLAARGIADLIDDEVVSDELIINAWPIITDYGRQVGLSQRAIETFLAGPKRLFPVSKAAEAGDEEDGDAEDGNEEDGDAEDGDAEDGDAEDGDAEDGDAEDGDAEDGNAVHAEPRPEYQHLRKRG